MIEAVTGMTLGEFFKERIFDPLGMSDTSFEIAREDVGRLAPCFRFKGRSNGREDEIGLSEQCNSIPFAEFGKYEMVEQGDVNTMYLRGKPQAWVQFTKVTCMLLCTILHATSQRRLNLRF